MFEGYTRVVTGGLSEKLTSGQRMSECEAALTYVGGAFRTQGLARAGI